MSIWAYQKAVHRKLGLMLWMLSNGELSAKVKAELQKLCSALDNRAFDAAMQIQVLF